MDKAEYYGIFTDQSGVEGIPGSLQLRMFEAEVQGDPFGRENAVSYDWTKAGFNEYRLKLSFILYSKVDYLNFDYYRYANDFLISEDFLNVIDQYHVQYEKAVVKVLNAADHRELEHSKKYYFVKFRYAEDVVDFEQSKFEDALSDKGEPILHNGVRYVKNYEKIVLHEDRIPADIFLIKDAKLGYNLLCRTSVKENPAVQQLNGLIFIPLDEFMDFRNNHGSLGKAAYERMKNRGQPKQHDAVQPTAAVDMNRKLPIQYRELTAEERTEVERLAGLGKSRLTATGYKSAWLIDQLAHDVDNLKSNHTNAEYLAYELGSVYGQLISNQYGWHWTYITVDGEGTICVQSPDRYFACKVHHYFYSLLTTDRTNNLKLLFNMMEDLSKAKTQNEITFLN